MNAPDDIFTSAPDWWIVAPRPMPAPMTADEYQREQIATAQSEAAQEAAHKEFSK
jgi:hypothetical protein